jgi:guanylate kinase
MSQILIISAPSGSGKSTLVARLLKADPSLLFSVSYTSRAPRGTEVNGRQYHFVSRSRFEQMLAAGEFLEWAQVFGNYYGTHRSVLERGEAEGRDVVLDIDVQGARQLSEKIPHAVGIFILAPSRDELAKRLRARSEDSEEVIGRRLAAALGEIKDFGRYDYILVNDDVEEASQALLAIVKAARARRTNPDVERRVKEIEATFSAPVITAGQD